MTLREEIDQMIEAKALEAQGVERAMLSEDAVTLTRAEEWQVVSKNLEAIREALGRLADEIDGLRTGIR